MATTNQCQIEMSTKIGDWLTNSPVAFDTPFDLANLRAYNSTPDEQANSPNWCIVAVVHTVNDAFVSGGDRFPARLAILLMSRLATDRADREASREAAERWINDAEEVVMIGLADDAVSSLWSDIEVVKPPMRDPDRKFHQNYRTSMIVVDVDKL